MLLFTFLLVLLSGLPAICFSGPTVAACPLYMSCRQRRNIQSHKWASITAQLAGFGLDLDSSP